MKELPSPSFVDSHWKFSTSEPFSPDKISLTMEKVLTEGNFPGNKLNDEKRARAQLSSSHCRKRGQTFVLTFFLSPPTNPKVEIKVEFSADKIHGNDFLLLLEPIILFRNVIKLELKYVNNFVSL